jgi:hypothetical protein
MAQHPDHGPTTSTAPHPADAYPFRPDAEDRAEELAATDPAAARTFAEEYHARLAITGEVDLAATTTALDAIDAIADLRDRLQTIEWLRAQLHSEAMLTVDTMRIERGMSWAAIGRILSISKQAAWQRFANSLDAQP